MDATHYNTLHIHTTPNGVVRVYGNGGLVFEARASYIRLESFTDSNHIPESGVVPPLKGK